MTLLVLTTLQTVALTCGDCDRSAITRSESNRSQFSFGGYFLFAMPAK
ncbi:hypothetical protein [Chamaesiphon sp. VAR_69_metabat_338]|nr:hypothetical protein [Chamaesiphon sp. VAR_69_metabat_338]